MAGANEDEVLANIQAKKEIRDALDWERYEGTDKASKLMPPRAREAGARLNDVTLSGKAVPRQLRGGRKQNTQLQTRRRTGVARVCPRA